MPKPMITIIDKGDVSGPPAGRQRQSLFQRRGTLLMQLYLLTRNERKRQ
jgi:hypothetical protein